MNVNKFNLKTTNKRSTIMIFLNEDIVNSGAISGGMPRELKKLNEEFGLNEADFAQFANPNAGYEICYEMELAFNTLERQMLNEEAAILLSEAEEDEKESKGFWMRIADAIKRWAKAFLNILAKAWNAITNFFTKIWEFLFGKKAKENVEETKKELKLAPRDVKYKFVKVDFDAIKAMWDKIRKIEAEAKKSIDGKEVVIEAKSIREFTKDVREELDNDVKQFKENKDAVIGSPAEAEKNLENAMHASGFVDSLKKTANTCLTASKDMTKSSEKCADRIETLASKADKTDKEKEELKKLRSDSAAYKALSTLYRNLSTTCTSITSTVGPAVRGAQNPKKVRA